MTLRTVHPHDRLTLPSGARVVVIESVNRGEEASWNCGYCTDCWWLLDEGKAHRNRVTLTERWLRMHAVREAA